MTDYFQKLHLPRTAALEGELLQQLYVERSRQVHPDHGGSEKEAAEVNAAFEILRASETRLKHLMDLVAPEEVKVWRTIPLDEAMMSLFGRLGQALGQASILAERKNNAQTALAKALLARQTLDIRDELENIGLEVASLKQSLETELPECDRLLSAAESVSEAWKKVATLQAKMAYAARWQKQIREQLLTLDLDF